MGGNTKDEERRLAQPVKQEALRFPARHDEIDGIEMGVLDNGVPYLTSRGLSRLCGVAPSAIIELTGNWSEHSTKPRGLKIRELLAFHGHPGDVLASQIEVRGSHHNAHPDAVCMAILEYYAFEVGKEKARAAFRLLARKTLRDFIYEKVGYLDPTEEAWRNFREIAEMNIAPTGYFSIFKESSELLLTSIRHGLPLAPHTIPDISIGQVWGAYWRKEELRSMYGERKRHPHRYPSNYPQSKADPEAWVYPNSALGEYRNWFETIYLPEKYPAYLKGKVKRGEIGTNEVSLLLKAISADAGNIIDE